MKAIVSLLLGLAISTLIYAQTAPEGAVQKLSEVKDITSANTPIDIYVVMKAKIEQGQYEDAAVANVIALAYGKYDTYRVEDESAHQAVIALGQPIFADLPMERKEKFMDAVQFLMKDKKKMLEILTRVGKPSYYPKYMIEHGMGAFLGNKSKDGLVRDFDPEKAWRDTLSSFVGIELGPA